MSASTRPPVFGPCPPPSKWSLGHVPTTALDLIVDHLASFAIEEHHCDHPICHFSADYPGTSNFTPLSLELTNMALVNHAFRENVFHRKIMPTLMLGLPEDMAVVRKNVSEHNLTFVKHIILIRIDESEVDLIDWDSERAKIFALVPNLESILDESAQVAYYAEYPSTVVRLSFVLQYGKKMPVPIQAPGLRKLLISSSISGRLENHYNNESGYYTKKAQIMLKDIKRLDNLDLQLPATSAPRGWPARRLPEAMRTLDPLPKTLKEVGTLAVQIPYSTVDGNTLREAHWWAYLRWLFDTTPKYHHLIISMDWNLGYMLSDELTPRGILDSMSLQLVKVNGCTGEFHMQGDPTTQDMKDFLADILHMRPDLQTVTLACKAVSPSLGGCATPCSIRSVKAIKLAGKGAGKWATQYEDEIDDRSVEMVVDDSMTALQQLGCMDGLGPVDYLDQMLPGGLGVTEVRAAAMMSQFQAVDLEEDVE